MWVRFEALWSHILKSEALFGANRGSKFLALGCLFDFWKCLLLVHAVESTRRGLSSYREALWFWKFGSTS